VTTVSIGLVHVAQHPTTLEASLRAADMACYMAKEKVVTGCRSIIG
jgi:GGDEF domain-containing protein